MARKKSKNTGLIVALLVASVIGGGAMAAYVVSTPGARIVPDDMRRELPTRKEAPSTQSYSKVVPRTGNDGLTSFTYQKIEVPRGEDARVFLVNDYLSQLHDRGLGNPAAKAIGCDVRERVAHLSFNNAFNETYGTFDEAAVLNGILTTMGQFEDVDKVQFEIEGKPMETMGNEDLTRPIAVLRDVKLVASANDSGKSESP